MLRLITCQTATLLLEQHADELASAPADLSQHLHYCPYCSRYAQQTMQIAGWARAAAEARLRTNHGLSEAAKERMRQRLAATE